MPDATAVSAEVFGKADYSAGFKSAGDFALPAEHDTYTLSVDRTGFVEDGQNVVVTAEISYDGGKTWEHLCGFDAGGVYVDKPIPYGDHKNAFVRVPVLKGKGQARQVRVHLDAKKAVNTKVECVSDVKGLVAQAADVPRSAVFDAASSVNFNAALTSTSWTHTPAGTPTGVGVGVGVASVGSTGISAMTYGGAACTQAADQTFASSGVNFRSTIYGKVNPTSGAQTVAITFGDEANGWFGEAGAITVTGGDTTTLFSNTANATGTGTTPTVNCTSASNELVMDSLVSALESSVTVGAGQTQRYQGNGGAGGTNGSGSTEPGAASVTMSWTRNTLGTDFGWAICAASFKSGAAGDVLWAQSCM